MSRAIIEPVKLTVIIVGVPVLLLLGAVYVRYGAVSPCDVLGKQLKSALLADAGLDTLTSAAEMAGAAVGVTVAASLIDTVVGTKTPLECVRAVYRIETGGVSEAAAMLPQPVPAPQPQRSLEAIKTHDIAVTSHPDVPGELLVQMSLVNEASYPQPFPIVEMRFASADGALVAAQAFSPNEYVVNPTGQLEPGVPVMVRLNMHDPGLEAINYVVVLRQRPDE